MTAARLQGLDDAAAQQVIAAAQALGLRQADRAAAQLAPVLNAYPDHPEVLRLHAGILSLRGDYLTARTVMEQAISLRPVDALYHNTLGTILGDSGDFDGAILALRRASELQPNLATAWFNLGVMLARSVRNTEATKALRRAVELAPDHMDARALLGDMLRIQGRAEEAAAEFRKVLAECPSAGRAWWGLADLRTGALVEADIERIRTALRGTDINDYDRTASGFALAKALDEYARYDESLEELKRANAIARQRQRWNAPAFSTHVTSIIDAFAPPPAAATRADPRQRVIFIVGMPRSGTTLVEQILASHSQVEGAGELPELPLVIGEESRRRGQAFPRWVAEARPEDWQRMGERYLERTAHWRGRPMFTDKLPGNWPYVGAIRAMLPNARVVITRRDPLETCFSCYRQLLPHGSEFSRTPEDLAAFWRDFDRSANRWAAQNPSHVYQHDYEEMIADPERSIRRLLEACGLPFEDACLRFHETARDVRSPSATQVRRPLSADTARAQRYGALLDPLRHALGLPMSAAQAPT